MFWCLFSIPLTFIPLPIPELRTQNPKLGTAPGRVQSNLIRPSQTWSNQNFLRVKPPGGFRPSSILHPRVAHPPPTQNSECRIQNCLSNPAEPGNKMSLRMENGGSKIAECSASPRLCVFASNSPTQNSKYLRQMPSRAARNEDGIPSYRRHPDPVSIAEKRCQGPADLPVA